MPVSVGIDLVEVQEVRDSVRVHGEHFLQRVYTAREREAWGAEARHLAACFAAKEATLKLLGGATAPWREIEVVGPPSREQIALSGSAAMIAQQRGVSELNLSTSYTREKAMAIAFAVLSR